MVVAAYLNTSFGIHYPYEQQEIKDMWTAAVNYWLDPANAADPCAGFKQVYSDLGAANEIGCPIGQGVYVP